jgi:hypothetical protein
VNRQRQYLAIKIIEDRRIVLETGQETTPQNNTRQTIKGTQMTVKRHDTTEKTTNPHHQTVMLKIVLQLPPRLFHLSLTSFHYVPFVIATNLSNLTRCFRVSLNSCE